MVYGELVVSLFTLTWKRHPLLIAPQLTHPAQRIPQELFFTLESSRGSQLLQPTPTVSTRRSFRHPRSGVTDLRFGSAGLATMISALKRSRGQAIVLAND